MMDTAGRAQLLFGGFLAMGVAGFLFLCVSASTCGACYVDPCVHPPGLKTLYKVNSSLCFAGVSSGMFFCFLSGWGALLTLRRRASVMGFGHFFGSCCVTFLVAVQSAGMWGAESTLLEEFAARKIYEEAIVDGMYEQVRVKPNKALHKSCRFLFTTSVLFSVALMCLAPLYFVSRDVYEDDESGERASASLRERAARLPVPAPSRRGISAYNPIPGPDRSQGGDDERQYLGRAALPLRTMPPADSRFEGV
mmetsp:Transcript_22838/g.68575  ORF Transcript_22838/g.68575 Transcript_22838/m.68575 type:complete len:251 (+) Transcript_22838:174-926(+)